MVDRLVQDRGNIVSGAAQISVAAEESKFIYSYYELGAGQFANLEAAGFDADGNNRNEATAEGRTSSIDVAAIDREHGGDGATFAVKYETTLTITQEGTYSFGTASDDGSMLFVDGQRIVTNDGIHPTVTQTGDIRLAAGEHKIEVIYYENHGGEVLNVFVAGPDTGGDRSSLSNLDIAAPAAEDDNAMEGTVRLPGLDITTDYTGTVTFLHEGAGYKNTLGMYEIGENGEIGNVSIVFANSSAVGSGGDLTPGESSVEVQFSAGTTVGFFLIPNGFSGNNTSYLFEGQENDGMYEFRDAQGNAIDTGHVGPSYLYYVPREGEAVRLGSAANGATWHSAGSDELGFGMNADGFNHTRFTLQQQEDGRQLLDMGFEDLMNLGDRDFDDTMFRLDIGADNITQVARDMTDGEPAGLADLTIRSISLDNQAPELGQDVWARLDVANIGEADAFSTSSAYYWSPTDTFDRDTAVRVDSDNHGTLQAGETDYGETERLRYEDLSSLGDGYIFAVIDDEDAIAEEDGTNNVSEGVAITFGEWTGLADLTINRMWAPSTDLALGQDMFVNLSISNNGFVQALDTKTTFYWSATDTFDAETAVEIDHDNHGTMKIGETDSNEMERIRYEDIAELGNGYIFGVIDAANLTEEGDETNNVSEALAVTLQDVVPSDLTVEDIRVRSASLSAGEDLIVTFDVANSASEGSEGQEGQSYVGVSTGIYWSATDTFDAETAVRVDSAHQGRIREGEVERDSEEVKYEDLAELGDGFIFAVVDDQNEQTESNEDNNVSRAVAFTIEDTSDADLQINRLQLSQGRLEDGEDTFVYLDVQNTGDSDANSVRTTLFWSPTAEFDESTAVALDEDHHGLLRSGEIETDEKTRVRYEELEELGNGYIFGSINNGAAIDETDSGNNLSEGAQFFLI